jgi:hypothetical protein
MSATQIGQTFGAFGTPPDTTGAIGPNNWMQYNNGGLAIFNKTGTATTALFSEQTFWQNAGLSSTIASQASGDPRIIYDQLSGRWVVTAFTSGRPSDQILVARSDTSNPNGTWKAVAFQSASGVWADFPTLGVDQNGVTIGVNNFNGSNQFTGVFVYSIPKGDLFGTTPTLANMTTFANTSTGGAAQAVNNFSLTQTTSSPTQLLSASPATGGISSTQILLTPITGVGAPAATLGTTSGQTVSSYVAAASVPIVNSTGTGTTGTFIQTNDSRAGSAVYRVGNLIYMAHETSVASHAALRISVFNASSAVPTLLTEQTISDPTFDTYFPSIAANARGDVVVGYTRSGFVSSGSPNNLYPSSYASVGTLTGSTLTFGTPIQLRAGQATYSGVDGSPYRWGDYSSTNLDPADHGIFWTTQEYSTNDNVLPGPTNYGTQVTELIPTVAGETRWKTAAGGNYTTPGSWFNSALPASTDHVIYSRNGDGTTNYTVTLPAGTTPNNRVSVRQGVITFSIPGGAIYNLTNTGDGSTDTTATNNPTSLASLAIADYLGTARLTVSGGGTLQTVTTTIAAQLNGLSTTAVSAGSLTITGSGSSWSNSGDVFVGGNKTGSGGIGSITIGGGATAIIGGNLEIWNNSSAVSVGSGVTAGTLTVNQLTNPAGTTPTITVANNGSVLTLNAAGSPLYTGTIALSSGGKLNGAGSIGGQVQIGSTGGTLQGGTGGGTAVDKLTLGGLQIGGGPNTILTTFSGTHTSPTASLIELGSGVLSWTAGVTTIKLAVSGAFDAGQSYTIPVINFGSTSGLTIQNPPPGSQFAIDMNPIGFAFSGTPTLSYDSTSNPHNLLITFVPMPTPEPGAMLAVAGLALAAGWRVRRASRAGGGSV